MTNNLQIIPAILATSESEYEEELKKIEDSQAFSDKWVQIDFMDNKFVQNHSIAPEIIDKYKTSFHLEAHLMVIDTQDWISKLLQTEVERIIIPLEDEDQVRKSIEQVKKAGLEVD